MFPAAVVVASVAPQEAPTVGVVPSAITDFNDSVSVTSPVTQSVSDTTVDIFSSTWNATNDTFTAPTPWQKGERSFLNYCPV